MSLPYPPPYQDIATLAEHICASESTIENWVRLGVFPEPKKVGGKRLWSWKEVERHLAANNLTAASPDELAERIKNGTKKAVSRG
jgi:predicted DNA-binding transcriptional regulator AlpA